jgi:hydroxymethylpyrimidine pyrophosphatase-like HAD family hydrolase
MQTKGPDKARVFISCGQHHQQEKDMANRVKYELESRGYQTYVAVQQQSLRGVTENIFSRLKEYEYFLFIDFKRERLINENGKAIADKHGKKIYRGSLFSHQELAIAAYLQQTTTLPEIIAFQEKGVRPLDGILGFVQANPDTFENENELVARVVKRLKGSQWTSTWQNRLELRRDDVNEFDDATQPSLGPYRKGRWYHITVENKHKGETAADCTGYVEDCYKILRGKGKEKINLPEPVELKWKGVTDKEVLIRPDHERSLDAFYVFKDSQDKIHLAVNQLHVDFSDYLDAYVLQGPGRFELTYIVYSSNFPPAKSTFTLDIRKEDLEKDWTYEIGFEKKIIAH